MKKFRFIFIGSVLNHGDFQLVTYAFSIKEAMRNFHYQIAQLLKLENRIKLSFRGKIISEVLGDKIEYTVNENNIEYPKGYQSVYQSLEYALFLQYDEELRQPIKESQPLIEDEDYNFEEYTHK